MKEPLTAGFAPGLSNPRREAGSDGRMWTNIFRPWCLLVRGLLRRKDDLTDLDSELSSGCPLGKDGYFRLLLHIRRYNCHDLCKSLICKKCPAMTARLSGTVLHRSGQQGSFNLRTYNWIFPPWSTYFFLYIHGVCAGMRWPYEVRNCHRLNRFNEPFVREKFLIVWLIWLHYLIRVQAR